MSQSAKLRYNFILFTETKNNKSEDEKACFVKTRHYKAHGDCKACGDCKVCSDCNDVCFNIRINGWMRDFNEAFAQAD